MKEYKPVPINTIITYVGYLYSEDEVKKGVVLSFKKDGEPGKNYYIDRNIQNKHDTLEAEEYIRSNPTKVDLTSFYLVRPYSPQFEQRVKKYMEAYKKHKACAAKYQHRYYEFQKLFKKGRRNFYIHLLISEVLYYIKASSKYLWKVIICGSLLIVFGGFIRVYRCQFLKLKLKKEIELQEYIVNMKNVQNKKDPEIILAEYKKEYEELNLAINNESNNILALIVAIIGVIIAIKSGK